MRSKDVEEKIRATPQMSDTNTVGTLNIDSKFLEAPFNSSDSPVQTSIQRTVLSQPHITIQRCPELLFP